MAVEIGSAPPGEEGPPIAQRIAKLGIAIAAAGILFYTFYDLIGNVLSGASRSKLDGDYIEISNAIKRFELEKKKAFQEWDLDKLQGVTLTNSVRDPAGKPYIYDWFHHRLVYTGKDGVLQTAVPGQQAEAGDSDDEVQNLQALDRLVYAKTGESGPTLCLATADGQGEKVLTSVPGVVDVRGLGAKESNLIALSITAGAGSKLAVVDVSLDKPSVADICQADKKNEWPALYDPKTEWVFYQSDRETPGKTHIYKMSHKEKVPAKLTTGDASFAQPSVELKNRWVWFAGNAGAGWALYRFQLSSYSDPQRRMAIAGKDLKAPAPSASGDFVAYLATTGGKTALEVSDQRSGKIMFSATDVVPESAIVWSPDDEKIGYLVKDGADTKMALTHVLRKVTTVLPQPIVGRSFAWLHD